MKFKIEAVELAKTLQIASKSLLVKTNLPVLANFLVTASGKSIEVVSTDLETATRIKTPVNVEKEGRVTLTGRTLLEFVSQLPSGEVTVESIGEEVVLTSGSFSARLATVAADEFPVIPRVDKGVTLEIRATDFIDAAMKVAFSAAQDEARPILTGVLLEANKKTLSMVATDGYRLSFKEIPADVTGSVKVVVPARAVIEIAKILADLGTVEEKFKLIIADSLNQVSFKIADVEFTSRLIEGDFPNWQKTIPSEFSTKVKISKEDLIKLVKVASIFARDSGNIVRLKFENPANGKGGSVNVSATAAQVGTTQAGVDVEITGKGGEIAFNYRYILEVLSVIEDDEVNFEMIESLNPGKITGSETSGFFHIIMPVRLQS